MVTVDEVLLSPGTLTQDYGCDKLHFIGHRPALAYLPRLTCFVRSLGSRQCGSRSIARRSACSNGQHLDELIVHIHRDYFVKEGIVDQITTSRRERGLHSFYSP